MWKSHGPFPQGADNLQSCFLMGYSCKPKDALPILRSHLHSVRAPSLYNIQTGITPSRSSCLTVTAENCAWKTRSSDVRFGILVKMEMVPHLVPFLGELAWGSGGVEIWWRTRQNTNLREISTGPSISPASKPSEDFSSNRERKKWTGHRG